MCVLLKGVSQVYVIPFIVSSDYILQETSKKASQVAHWYRTHLPGHKKQEAWVWSLELNSEQYRDTGPSVMTTTPW